MADETGAMSLKLWAPLVHESVVSSAQPGITRWEIQDIFYDRDLAMLISADHG